jgi:hypothetical protein
MNRVWLLLILLAVIIAAIFIVRGCNAQKASKEVVPANQGLVAESGATELPTPAQQENVPGQGLHFEYWKDASWDGPEYKGGRIAVFSDNNRQWQLVCVMLHYPDPLSGDAFVLETNPAKHKEFKYVPGTIVFVDTTNPIQPNGVTQLFYFPPNQ